MTAQSMTINNLEAQNRFFKGTGGTSSENRDLGFVPAFLDRETGVVYRSCRADGSPSPIHLMDGLPEALVVARNTTGGVYAVKGSVVAGFIRNGRFYTREQAARTLR